MELLLILAGLFGFLVLVALLAWLGLSAHQKVEHLESRVNGLTWLVDKVNERLTRKEWRERKEP